MCFQFRSCLGKCHFKDHVFGTLQSTAIALGQIQGTVGSIYNRSQLNQLIAGQHHLGCIQHTVSQSLQHVFVRIVVCQLNAVLQHSVHFFRVAHTVTSLLLQKLKVCTDSRTELRSFLEDLSCHAIAVGISKTVTVSLQPIRCSFDFQRITQWKPAILNAVVAYPNPRVAGVRQNVSGCLFKIIAASFHGVEFALDAPVCSKLFNPVFNAALVLCVEFGLLVKEERSAKPSALWCVAGKLTTNHVSVITRCYVLYVVYAFRACLLDEFWQAMHHRQTV